MAVIGVPREDRDYRPHLTLARARDGMSKESLGAIHRAVAAIESREFGSFQAATQVLYRSAGSEYTKLREFSLLSS